MQKIGFDDWACDQEIEYTLVAKVNGEVAYKRTTADLDIIESELIHAEEETIKLLNDQYYENDLDYDAMAEDMRILQDVEL